MDEKIKKILSKIIENSPEYASEQGGDIYCFFCGVWIECGEKHDEDCVYLEIQKLMKEEEGI